jgi:sec-independent protein translocase protein TatA
MGGLSIWHWIIVGGVVFILFGGKFKISDVMGDVAKGIKAFKKGMAEDEEVAAKEAAKPLEHQATPHLAEDKSTTDARKL